MKNNQVKRFSFSFLHTRVFKGGLLALFLLCGAMPTVNARQKLASKVELKTTNITIQEIVNYLTKETDYSFFFKSDDIDTQQIVSVDISSNSIDEVLTQALAKTNLSYAVKEKNIVIYEKAATKSAVQVTQQAGAAQKGTIVDLAGEPVIGATITIKGTTTGAISDIDGNFNINVKPGDIIEVRYVGYKTESIKYNKPSDLNIILKEDSEVLDELVVVGYGVQKKVNLSGSVAAISEEVLKNRPVTNTAQALQGVAGNLNVTMSSGQATSAPSINIRGTGTIGNGSSANPLIVIDGVVSSEGDLKDLNPADISDISVLKDASSAAIYGARAAFGVLIVTTKGGKSRGAEKLKVNYDNNFSFRTLSVKPDIVTDPATIVDMRNIFAYPLYNLYDANAVEYAKKRSADPTISPYYLTPKGEWEYFGNTNWFDEAYKDWGFATNHNVNISGATDKVSYYLSAGYQRTNGMLRQDNDIFNRYNFRSKLNFKLTDWWTLANNTSYSTTDYDSPTYLGGDYYWSVSRKNPLDMPKNPDGTWTKTGADILGRMQEGGRAENLTQRLQTQFTTTINLYKDIWTVNGNFALNRYTSNSENAYLSIPYKEGPELERRYYNETTSAGESSTHQDNLIFDVYSNFTKTFVDKHFVNVMAGFNQEEEKYKYFSASRKNLISESLPNMGLATGEQNVSSSRTSYGIRSFFYRLNYIYENKYIIEHNGRYDGSSRFDKNDRFVYNPSVSLAWVMSQEKFFAPLQDIVSFFKLRLSYGSLGNQSVGNYAYIPTMGRGKTSWILDGNEQPVYVSAPGLVSAGLTWETVVTKNIGFDLNFLGNKLTSSFDYYQRDTKDMLVAGTPLPSVLGTSVPRENAADLRTKGWELSVAWNDEFQLAGKPFRYNARFILSDNQSKVTKYSNPTGTLDSYYVGQKIGEMWGLTTLGYFQSEQEVKDHADQTLVTSLPGSFDLAPGDLKFADLNGDGKISRGQWTLADHGDYKIIGNTSPRYAFSLNLGAEWNDFDFSLFLQGIGKRDYYPGSGDLYFWGVNSQPWTNVNKSNLDYWTEDNRNAYFPRRKAYTAETGGKELAAVQTKYKQNAAYMRLKNITIGYTLPRSLTQKINIERLRFFFTGENLAEISGLDKQYKVDPEGLGGQMYPFSRVVSFGLNVQF